MAETLLEQVESEESSRETRQMDAELLAIQRIGRMLEKMDDFPRARVLVYLLSRYAPGILTAANGKVAIPVVGRTE